ncbi:MAG TPA: protein-L-isoaspartate(D-aspartate) O-methyltransferase [Gammaproteobacteria bacterium]|nr:protein-L-isoaspartate(D-aspartate) O-methyltransferase [Gammaproteobacteria bacterium]
MKVRHEGIGMTSKRTRERLLGRLRDKGIRNESVLNVIGKTPRHIFVDEALATRAYEDTALPIGFGQTISQPYIVARMTEALLANGPVKKVLEIGTGSGYQTAILAQLVDQVFSVERIQTLQYKARARLRELRLPNARYKHDDGVLGWLEYAPYDGIIVTAAPVEIPEQLLRQLAIGGRMLIPSGNDGNQLLRLIIRNDQAYEEHLLDGVAFVPLLNGVS